MTLATTLLSLLLAQAPTGDHRAETPPPRPLPPNAAALLRASFADDPPVSYLRNAATALARAEPERARSLIARARWAGLLPDVRVRLDRRFARTESLDLGRADQTATPVGVDANNDLRYELRATWELSRIVFNPDEIGASAHALRMADVRREIESAVIRVYFERRRLKAEALATDATDTASGVRLELHIQELEAELDALSGGAFSRWRSSRNGDPLSGPP
ncbi:MAG: hypothetical protein JWM82_4078 [Myxococcales bacterium]|jgi:hypothetical protein|nr:hypothetical protein [Myxococcales bacterium]